MSYSIEVVGSNVMVDEVVKDGESVFIGRVGGIGYHVPSNRFVVGDYVLVPKDRSYKVSLGDRDLHFVNHCSVF